MNAMQEINRMVKRAADPAWASGLRTYFRNMFSKAPIAKEIEEVIGKPIDYFAAYRGGNGNSAGSYQYDKNLSPRMNKLFQEDKAADRRTAEALRGWGSGGAKSIAAQRKMEQNAERSIRDYMAINGTTDVNEAIAAAEGVGLKIPQGAVARLRQPDTREFRQKAGDLIRPLVAWKNYTGASGAQYNQMAARFKNMIQQAGSDPRKQQSALDAIRNEVARVMTPQSYKMYARMNAPAARQGRPSAQPVAQARAPAPAVANGQAAAPGQRRI